MADAIVYATAMKETCPVVTSGRHFKGLEDVIYLEAQVSGEIPVNKMAFCLIVSDKIRGSPMS